MFVIEMRQKYDQGEDPLDPESGRGGGGGHPFHRGGQNFHFPGGDQFGGGPFQFKFHFNWSHGIHSPDINILFLLLSSSCVYY